MAEADQVYHKHGVSQQGRSRGLSAMRGAEMTLARWLARKAVKAHWLAQGIKLYAIEQRELAKAAEDYLQQNREQLLDQARAYLERFAQRRKR